METRARPPAERAEETLDHDLLLFIVNLEAGGLERLVRSHPALSPLFGPARPRPRVSELRDAYLRLLKVKADYVRWTVPMLRAAGEALRGGDDEDRAWSDVFVGYSRDETDTREGYGHHVWALDDMRALGAPEAALSAPAHPSVAAYARYFVDEAARHPYAILGAKAVLEHLSLRISDDLVQGVMSSGIEGAAGAVTFFGRHGVLDIDHVQGGDQNLARIRRPERRHEVLAGAYFTSGCYRAFLSLAV